MNSQPGFFAWLQQHPMIVGLFVVVAIFGVIFLKKNNTTATTGTTAAGDYSGLATDANGNPIIYRDVADEFVNVTKISGSYNSPVTSTSTSAATSTTTTTTNPAAPVEHPILPVVIAPAKKGSLSVTNGAGKKDTNFQVYTVPAGSTLTSLAEKAKWGTNAKKLADYRNNTAILKAAGVDTSNPYAKVPAGLKLSI